MIGFFYIENLGHDRLLPGREIEQIAPNYEMTKNDNKKRRSNTATTMCTVRTSVQSEKVFEPVGSYSEYSARTNETNRSHCAKTFH